MLKNVEKFKNLWYNERIRIKENRMCKKTELDLNEIKRQVAEDFPDVAIHPHTYQKANRYEVLLQLAVADYFDLKIKEQEHVKKNLFEQTCHKWICGDASYTHLLLTAKQWITKCADHKRTATEKMAEFEKIEAKNNYIVPMLKHILECFRVAFCSDIAEDFNADNLPHSIQ
jgi:hypothetical protein